VSERSFIEARSIDYVPLKERHGKVWHLWPVWFVGDAHLATIATGAVGIALGGNLLWTTIAVLIGSALGTFFMAFHSTQGPQLGLPQMIQSRPQFGYVGALLVWGVALVTYIGFNAFNQLLAADTLTTLWGYDRNTTMPIVAIIAALLAVVGYDWIHRIQRILAFILIAGLAVMTFAVATSAHTLGDALKGAHLFIGVSAADCVKPSDILGMADTPAIFAMANPDPEIRPELVAQTLASKPYIMATGRSDYPNQINNVLGFPFLFRGALDCGARTINLEMKMAAARTLADLARLPVPASVCKIYQQNLAFGPGYIIPKPFDERLFLEIPVAVAKAAMKSGAAPADALNLDIYRRQLVERNRGRLITAKP